MTASVGKLRAGNIRGFSHKKEPVRARRILILQQVGVDIVGTRGVGWWGLGEGGRGIVGVTMRR